MSVSTRTVNRPRAAGAGRTMTTFFSVFTWRRHTHTHTLSSCISSSWLDTSIFFKKSPWPKTQWKLFSRTFLLSVSRWVQVRLSSPLTLPVLHYKSSWHNWTATKKPTKNKNKKPTTSENPQESFLLLTVQLQTDEREKRVNTSLMQQHIKYNTLKCV